MVLCVHVQLFFSNTDMQPYAQTCVQHSHRDFFIRANRFSRIHVAQSGNVVWMNERGVFVAYLDLKQVRNLYRDYFRSTSLIVHSARALSQHVHWPRSRFVRLRPPLVTHQTIIIIQATSQTYLTYTLDLHQSHVKYTSNTYEIHFPATMSALP